MTNTSVSLPLNPSSVEDADMESGAVPYPFGSRLSRFEPQWAGRPRIPVAFLHQKCSDPKDVLWWITTLHEMVATDSHIELGVEFPTRTWAMGCCSLSVQQVSIEKVLPLDYSTIVLPPLVGVCSVPVSRNEQVAVLPLQSPSCLP